MQAYNSRIRCGAWVAPTDTYALKYYNLYEKVCNLLSLLSWLDSPSLTSRHQISGRSFPISINSSLHNFKTSYFVDSCNGKVTSYVVIVVTCKNFLIHTVIHNHKVFNTCEWRTLGFECEILLLIVSFYTRGENSQNMLHVTAPHCSTARAHDRKHARVINLMPVRSTCIHVYIQLSIIENKSSLILQSIRQQLAKHNCRLSNPISSPSHMPHLYS